MPVENARPHSMENYLKIFIFLDKISCIISDEDKKASLKYDLNISIDDKTDVSALENFFHQPEFDILSDNVDIYIENSVYQLIPSELFKEKDADKIFEIIFGKALHEQIKYRLLPKWNTHLVYRLPEKIADFFAERYPEADMQHHTFDLLRKFIKRTQDAVYLNVRKNAVDLALVKEGKLQLMSAFDVKTEEDICYFTLNMYEQFQLNTETFNLKIYPTNSETKHVSDLLKQYVLMKD